MTSLSRALLVALIATLCGTSSAALLAVQKYTLDLIYDGDRASLTAFQLGPRFGSEATGESLSTIEHLIGDPQRAIRFGQESLLPEQDLLNLQGEVFELATAEFIALTDTSLLGYFGAGNAAVFAFPTHELLGFDQLLVVGSLPAGIDVSSAAAIRSAVQALGANGDIANATLFVQIFSAATVAEGEQFTSSIYVLPGTQLAGSNVPNPGTLALVIGAICVLVFVARARLR